MQFIHSRGVIQRDLKLANSLLDERRRPKIGDLRSSRFCDSRFAMTSRVATPPYMAPETHEDADYTAAADVYSFSLISDEVWLGTCIPGEGHADSPVPEGVAA
jgi:serine/threonine protein kinase